MKRCFRCNQIVDNHTNTCSGCGNNYHGMMKMERKLEWEQ